MANKVKQDSLKSLRKTLLSKIEAKLSESLLEFPKKSNEKKYKKILHKAGKILTKSIAINPVKVASKDKPKKSKKIKPKATSEAAN